MTAQKGGDPACNGLKRCLEDVDSLSTDSRECACPSRRKKKKEKKTARRILRYSWKQGSLHPVLSRVILPRLSFLFVFTSPFSLSLSRTPYFPAFEDRKECFFDFIVTLRDTPGFQRFNVVTNNIFNRLRWQLDCGP